MKILISTAIFPNRAEPTRGTYILNQAIALATNHDVRVVSPIPYSPKVLTKGRYNVFGMIPRRDTIAGISVEYPRFFIIPKVFRFAHGACLFVSVLSRFRSIVSDFQPDVLLSFSAHPDGVAAVALAHRLGLPVVVGCIGNDINWKARRGVQRRVIARALRASDLVLTVCEDLKRSVERLGVNSENIAVIPNGVERNRFLGVTTQEARRRLELPDHARIVMCVSRLSEEKGIDVLIRAFERTSAANTALYIAGEGLHRRALEQLVARSPRRKDIHFLGSVPHSEVPIWLSAADLFVLPSRTEGHPNSLLEACASGLPSVATRVGGVPEVITSDEVGLLVDADDVDSMAQAIDTALARPWDRQRIVELAGSRTWDDVASEIVEQIETRVTSRIRQAA